MSLGSIAAHWFTRGLARYSNAHQGGTCYIFGDGPSIKWFDLGLLNRHPAICCGMIPFHRDFHRLDVRYAAFVAPWIFLPAILQPKMYHAFAEIAGAYAELVRRSPGQRFFVHWSNAPIVGGVNVS